MTFSKCGYSFFSGLLMVGLLIGCAEKPAEKTANTSSGNNASANTKDNQNGHTHSHGEDDALVWEGDPKEQGGCLIKLGHHGKHLHAGEEVEPAVSITRDGKPVDDAKVFNALFSTNGKELAKEVATVYEPTTDEEPAHYAQGGLMIPKGASEVVVRFRIILAGEEAVEYDMPISAH